MDLQAKIEGESILMMEKEEHNLEISPVNG